MKKAFTLSEMLICIAIMAVLVVLFLSSIRAKPNSNMVMFRKAYNITSSNVYEMLQSAIFYETGYLNNLQPTSQQIEGAYPSGQTKFCKVFANYVNTAGEPDCTSNKSKPSFSTLDGIDWYLPPKTTSGNFSGKEIVRVDVNGSQPPNCTAGSADCEQPDTFEIKISNVGKIYIDDDTAKKYLQNVRNVSK